MDIGIRKKMQKYDYYIHMDKLFDKIDKLFQKEFGKQCKDFVPLCPSCEFYLLYNNRTNALYYVLSHELPVTEALNPYNNSILICLNCKSLFFFGITANCPLNLGMNFSFKNILASGTVSISFNLISFIYITGVEFFLVDFVGLGRNAV